MARKTEIALLLETQNNLLQATSQNGRDGEDFLAGIFFFLFSVSRLYWGLFEFPDFFLPLSPSVPSLSFFKGGFFLQKLKYLSRASCVAWRGRGEVNWGGVYFLMVFEIKTPQVIFDLKKFILCHGGVAGAGVIIYV